MRNCIEYKCTWLQEPGFINVIYYLFYVWGKCQEGDKLHIYPLALHSCDCVFSGNKKCKLNETHLVVTHHN